MITAQQKQWAEEVYKKCIQKYQWVAKRNADAIPYTIQASGRYDNRADKGVVWNENDGLRWWTNGFWAGILWHLYVYTQDQYFADLARHSEEKLDACFQDFYGLHHDVGFMWIPTAVQNYRITAHPTSRKRALHAANLLAGRYNCVGKFIRAWDDLPNPRDDSRGWAIIDCMLNTPLLYWASGETTDPRYKHIANAHADTVMRTFFRPDGSCSHIVEYDPENGGMVRSRGGQGYADGSAWTRGQAWALYGFVVNSKLSGKPDHLQTAQRAADYFASQIPESGLIPIDFDQPPHPALEDSSAAAIAACGFLELARLFQGSQQERYEAAAIKLLRTLDKQRCVYDESCEAIVSHCSAAYHSPNGHHIYMVYADYFFMEALAKTFMGDTGFLW